MTGKGRKTLQEGRGISGVPVHDDLAAVVDTLIATLWSA
jgi:hypothetical protein